MLCPHEPFVAPERVKAAYDTGYNGKILDWPLYEKNVNSPEEIAAIRGNYAALVAMCDEYFGRLLDYFDAFEPAQLCNPGYRYRQIHSAAA